MFLVPCTILNSRVGISNKSKSSLPSSSLYSKRLQTKKGHTVKRKQRYYVVMSIFKKSKSRYKELKNKVEFEQEPQEEG